jgi:predicted RNA-binding Zn-ribbon protein involved in translation (DUF1610 family)
METDAPAHDCPTCGDTMRLARVTPKLGPHPALLTFQCGACGEVLTKVGDEDGDGSSE